MRASLFLPFALVSVALAALWAARAGETEAPRRGEPTSAGRQPAAAVSAPTPTPVSSPARQGARFVREVQSMADVHRLREQVVGVGADAIPELRELALTASDPIVAAEAIAALGRLGALAGDARLLALIDDARPKVRQQLLVALGHPGSAAAVGLLELGAIGSDADLRPLAIGSLGRIGGREAEASLRQLAQRADLGEIERSCVALALQRATRPGSGRRVERSPQPAGDALPAPVPALEPPVPESSPSPPPGMPTERPRVGWPAWELLRTKAQAGF